jgi:hypothetical protein
MNNFFYTPEKCPEHTKEYLKIITLGIYTPDDNDGTAYPVFNYCPTSNKIFDGKSMITLEEAALIMINSMYNKNYKLKDIKVILDLSKLVKKVN